MTSDRMPLIASAVVLGAGITWGFYWMPVRALTALGVAGGWGTVLILAATLVILTPMIALRPRMLRASPLALASVALGGAAFALYSVGLVYGRVAIIILVFFLTPVWSTLIGRFLMGWHTPRLRIVAIVLGLAGLGIMLSATGDLPLPRGAGEWMSLIAGVLWAFATTGMRVTQGPGPVASVFVFAVAAFVTTVVLVPLLDPAPFVAEQPVRIGLIALATGGAWWALSVGCLMWATPKLDPARVGVLMMIEVIVGAASAALLAGEHLAPLEIAGGVLVVLAGVVEVWPVREAKKDAPPVTAGRR